MVVHLERIFMIDDSSLTFMVYNIFLCQPIISFVLMYSVKNDYVSSS